MDDAAARAGTCTTPLATCITQTTQSSSVSKSSSSPQAADTAAYRREVHQLTLQFLQQKQSTTAMTTTAALESTEAAVNDRTNKKQQKQESIPLSIFAAQLRDSLEEGSNTSILLANSAPRSYCRGCGIDNNNDDARTDPTTVHVYPAQHLTLRLERCHKKNSCTDETYPDSTTSLATKAARTNEQFPSTQQQQRTNERVLSCRACGCVVARYDIRGQQPFDGNHHNGVPPVVGTPPPRGHVVETYGGLVHDVDTRMMMMMMLLRQCGVWK